MNTITNYPVRSTVQPATVNVGVHCAICTLCTKYRDLITRLDDDMTATVWKGNIPGQEFSTTSSPAEQQLDWTGVGD